MRARSERGFGIAMVLVVLAAVPALAQPVVQQGIDALTTQGGTSANVNLPQDYFCPGSPAVNASIPMVGKPLATNPANALGGADTVVERLKDAVLNPCANVPAVVRAVSLKNAAGSEIFACGANWRIDACTCGCGLGTKPITTLQICDDGSGGPCGQTCGTFSGQLVFDVCLTFTNLQDGTVLGPETNTITLNVNTPWCDTNPGGVATFSNALQVDSECDGVPDLAVACTSNFFPGAMCPNGGECPEPVCHPDPAGGHDHCVSQPCCGNGICEVGENCNTCPNDCPGGFAVADPADTTNATAVEGEAINKLVPYCCGNGRLETSEDATFCNGRI